MSVQLKVSGLDQLIGVLRKAQGGFTPVVQEYINDKVQQIANDYRSTVPVKTGQLRGSIYANRAVGFTATVGASAPYAIFIEEGTRYISAHYNLRNAVNRAVMQMRGGAELAQRIATILRLS